MVQSGLDGMLALCEVVADKERAKKYLAEIKDAGATAARLEAERHSEGLSRREEAVSQREEEVRRLAAEVEELAARGAELPGRLRAADVRDGELDAKSAASADLAAKLNQQAAELQVKEKRLEERFAAIRRVAMGAT